MTSAVLKERLFKAAQIFLWATWLYPFLRVAVILPIAAIEDYVSEDTLKKMLTAAKYLHGGALVSEFVSGIYMIYFALSVAVYLFRHFKTKRRIGWGQRVMLALVILYNIFNVFLLAMVATD